MVANYLKIAFRNFLRHKSFSLINTLGLAIGMPVCLLVILVVNGQRSLDQFQANKDRVFRVITRVTDTERGYTNDLATAPAPLAPLLKTDLPEVENEVRLCSFGSVVKYGDKIVRPEGFYAEKSFFTIFSFPLRAGNRNTALSKPFSAVLSAELGNRLFGDEDPIGRVLTLPYGDVVVTGVMDDLPEGERSHLRSDILVSFSTLQSLRNELSASLDPDRWESHTRFYQYLLLSNAGQAANVEAALPGILKGVERDDARYAYQCSLQPLTGIAFGPELVNQIGHVMEGTVLYIFLIVAFVIMVPVLFNYVSLTVARSLKRSKEVGIRKVLGAQRRHIVGQILFESMMVALLALIPAMLILNLLLPAFNNFQFTDYIGSGWISDWRVYAFFILFGVGAGLLAGIIPAGILSGMRPAATLRGLTRIRGFSGLTLRKAFLVVQFTLSLFFIILTTLFYRQVTYMLNADYGFDKEHVVSVRLQDVPYERFHNEAVRQAGVLDVSGASRIIGRANVFPELPIRSAKVSDPIRVVSFSVSESYLANLHFKLLAGRSFSRAYSTDSSEAIILNETAVRRLGFAGPAAAVGQVVTVGEQARMKIIGVTTDFHYARLQNPIDPVALRFDPKQFWYAAVRIAPNEMSTAMAGIEKVWKNVSGTMQPLQYEFMDEFILGAYNDMRDIVVFLAIIAGLAIAISCLGLLGMAIFSTETRVKEIGIRKVFGASSTAVVMLLSRDLVKLLTVAMGIVSILLWAFINFMFFERVAYRVELGAGIFLPGLILVVLLAFLTIGSQTIKAANRNPVDALKYE